LLARGAARFDVLLARGTARFDARLFFAHLGGLARSARGSAHVDVACDDVRAVCESHVAAGAQIAAEFAHWIAMTDPIGRPYCLTGRDPVTGVPTGRPVQG
jgi:hypothetical protein